MRCSTVPERGGTEFGSAGQWMENDDEGGAENMVRKSILAEGRYRHEGADCWPMFGHHELPRHGVDEKLRCRQAISPMAGRLRAVRSVRRILDGKDYLEEEIVSRHIWKRYRAELFYLLYIIHCAAAKIQVVSTASSPHVHTSSKASFSLSFMSMTTFVDVGAILLSVTSICWQRRRWHKTRGTR